MTIYPPKFQQRLKKLHSQGKKIVLVTGVFDVLHVEHQTFLQKARKLGEVLVVGVESDVRVKQMKGKDRPIWDQETRKKTIEQLHLADEVFILPEKFSTEEDHWRLIELVCPRYLAVSSHSPHLDQKKKILEKVGGEVVIVHQHNPAISTTLELKKTLHK